jgi:hypothetical protein
MVITITAIASNGERLVVVAEDAEIDFYRELLRDSGLTYEIAISHDTPRRDVHDEAGGHRDPEAPGGAGDRP